MKPNAGGEGQETEGAQPSPPPTNDTPPQQPTDPDTNATELWTTDDVAKYLRLSRASTRAQLSAWGIGAVGRQAGRAGLNLYEPGPIRALAERRPGQGHRTDLHSTDRP